MALLLRIDSFDATGAAETGRITVTLSVVDTASSPPAVVTKFTDAIGFGEEFDAILPRFRRRAAQARQRVALETRLTQMLGRTVPLEDS